MLLFNSVNMAFKNLRVNKMRTFLTMLGMIIGISSVIIVMSVGAGAQSLIVNQIQSLGTNVIGILPGASEEDGPPAAVFGIIITTLTDEDAKQISKQVPHIEAVSSYVTLTETVLWKNAKTDGSIQGVSTGYPIVSDSLVEEGDFFTEDDEKALANVAVIGNQVKDDLFGNTPAIGETIRIKKQNFRIIGVMEPKGVSGFQNVDKMVFIPVTTVQKKLTGINHVGFIRAKVDNESNVTAATEQIVELLRDRHNIDNPTQDDFTARDTSQAIDTLSTITGALTLFLASIASISLVVGGVGIMNIMLAAVLDRIREIGLRKAVGAKKSTITGQFLVETIILSFTGAIIGILIGVLFSFLVAVIMNYLNYDWDFVVTLSSIATATIISILIGLIFGFYPARRASKLDPIVALRYE